MDRNDILEILRLKPNGHLYHREGQTVEFKEQFNFAGLADYFRDFAAFANNKGGYLIHGVTDSPRELKGLSDSSLNQFEKIDPEKINGYLLDIFNGHIEWEQAIIEINDLSFGVFKINSSILKPIVAKKDEGREQIIRNGEIYFRYGGRTQKIKYSELEAIINSRIKENNDQWLDLMSKIGKAGPQNAAILDTEKSLIQKKDSTIMVIDKGLANKLKFIKEGEFVEKHGFTTLKLVGDDVPIDKVEIIKKVKENLLKEYPLSALQLANKVQKLCQNCKHNSTWRIISDNDLKNNPDYSTYNFRNKQQEDNFLTNGIIPGVTPSIYKESAVDFIINVFNNEKEK